MIVHRFMSKREYDALMAGNVLHNETDHKALGRGDTLAFVYCRCRRVRYDGDSGSDAPGVKRLLPRCRER